MNWSQIQSKIYVVVSTCLEHIFESILYNLPWQITAKITAKHESESIVSSHPSPLSTFHHPPNRLGESQVLHKELQALTPGILATQPIWGDIEGANRCRVAVPYGQKQTTSQHGSVLFNFRKCQVYKFYNSTICKYSWTTQSTKYIVYQPKCIATCIANLEGHLTFIHTAFYEQHIHILFFSDLPKSVPALTLKVGVIFA